MNSGLLSGCFLIFSETSSVQRSSSFCIASRYPVLPIKIPPRLLFAIPLVEQVIRLPFSAGFLNPQVSTLFMRPYGILSLTLECSCIIAMSL